MPKIKCIGCGKSKLIPHEKVTLQTVINEGYNFVWKLSDGLTSEMLCSECAEKVRNHVHAIEDTIKIEIGLLNLSDYSKLSIKT